MSGTADIHSSNQNIPSVYVEDTAKHDEHANPLSNLELFRKINALLDNTLDLSALGLANITFPQSDTSKAIYTNTTLPASQTSSQTGYENLSSLQMSLPNLDLYNANQTDQSLAYSVANATSYTGQPMTSVGLSNPYSTNYSQPANTYASYAQPTPSIYSHPTSAVSAVPSYNPAPGGLTQSALQALTQLIVAGLSQIPIHTPAPPQPPCYVSQPQAYNAQCSQAYNAQCSQYSQYNPYLQHQAEINASFIPGAISNRTLEQLTESSMRPYRAIKAATDKHTYTPSEPAVQTGMSHTNNVGTIGDRGYHTERQSSPDGKNVSRSASPTDSDSSGFSSGSDSFSDTALADLMNSLSMSSTQQTQTQPPQTAPVFHPQQQQYVPATQAANYSHQPLTSTQQSGYGGQQQYATQPGVSAASQLSLSQQQQQQQQQQLYQQQPAAYTQQSVASQLQHNQLTAAAALAAQANAQPQLDLVKAIAEYSFQSDALRKAQQQPMINDFSLSAELFNGRTNAATTAAINTILAANNNADSQSIEKAAKMYRNAATVCEPNCTWSGQLPPKVHKNPTYSCKVFLGGVPWDITEVGLQNAFKMFGSMKIEWPGKDGMHPRYIPKAKSLPAGYVYVLFESEKSIKSLLQSCTHDFSNGGEYYFRISSRRMRSKEVQVIPWVLGDSNFVKQPSQRLDPSKTVFVGALHGMMNAEGLAHIMNDLFGNVVYAGIDTDKHKYPIGSGRVTFSSHKSYMKAVNAAFVEVKTPKFTKKIQIDPYLEDSMCQSCNIQQGPYFCRDLSCFRYYCKSCWQWYHALDTTRAHKPLMRNNKGTANSPALVTSV